jgi:predicted PurR-regulated permease PerM
VPVPPGGAAAIADGTDELAAAAAGAVVPADATPRPGETLRTVAQLGLLILASLAAVYFARDVLIPLVFAVVLQLALSPAMRAFTRVGIPEVLSAAVLLTGMVGLLMAAVYTLAAPATEWTDRLPQIMSELERKIEIIRKPLEEVTKASKEVEQIASVGGQTPQVPVGEIVLLSTVAGGVGELVIVLAITFIIAYFLLASGDLFRAKLVHVMPRLQDKKRALQIVKEIEQSVTRYLLTIALVNLCVGVIVGAGMLVIGLPNPVLWAAMAVFLSFIPVIGAWLGIGAIAIVAILTFDSLAQALIAPALYGIVHMIAENFVTPAVLGRRLTLNPVVLVLNVLLWVWLWGIPGALLAGPILITVKVLCDHFPALSAVAEFLSGPDNNGAAKGTKPA